MTTSLPDRSPKQDLAEALGTLERLAIQFATGAARPRVEFFLAALEADLDYAIDPVQLVQHPAKP